MSGIGLLSESVAEIIRFELVSKEAVGSTTSQETGDTTNRKLSKIRDVEAHKEALHEINKFEKRWQKIVS